MRRRNFVNLIAGAAATSSVAGSLMSRAIAGAANLRQGKVTFTDAPDGRLYRAVAKRNREETLMPTPFILPMRPCW